MVLQGPEEKLSTSCSSCSSCSSSTFPPREQCSSFLRQDPLHFPPQSLICTSPLSTHTLVLSLFNNPIKMWSPCSLFGIISRFALHLWAPARLCFCGLICFLLRAGALCSCHENKSSFQNQFLLSYYQYIQAVKVFS